MTDLPDPPRPKSEGADSGGPFAKFEALRRNYGLELDKAYAAGTAPLKPMPGLTATTEPSTILVVAEQ